LEHGPQAGGERCVPLAELLELLVYDRIAALALGHLLV
jgi:hypothetical protein